MIRLNTTKLALACIITISTSACSTFDISTDNFSMLSPKPFLMRNIPDGKDSYSQGFRDACYIYLGNHGFGIHRFYTGGPDPKSIYDKQYKSGYTDGDRYCGTYTNQSIIL